MKRFAVIIYGDNHDHPFILGIWELENDAKEHLLEYFKEIPMFVEIEDIEDWQDLSFEHFLKRWCGCTYNAYENYFIQEIDIS